jgi:CHAT domain-containing protein
MEFSELIGPDATLDRVAAELSTADAIHVACHGRLNSLRMNESHIKMASNGRLDRDLRLSIIQQSRLVAGLVVLTSCHAGVTTVALGNEVGGFVRELLAAGTRNVVAPLWEIDDEAAFFLVRTLYSGLFGGQAVDEAMRFAKIALLQTERFASAQYLAPIQLFGIGWSFAKIEGKA